MTWHNIIMGNGIVHHKRPAVATQTDKSRGGTGQGYEGVCLHSTTSLHKRSVQRTEFY